MEKRYLLFAGIDHEEKGGIYDMVGGYESKSKAMSALDKKHPPNERYVVPNLWAHIFDLHTFKIVRTFCLNTWFSGDIGIDEASRILNKKNNG